MKYEYNVCYILKSNYDYPIDSVRKDNDRMFIQLLCINPELFTSSCMKRFDTVFCDKSFMDTEKGRILVENIFKPLAIKDFLMI